MVWSLIVIVILYFLLTGIKCEEITAPENSEMECTEDFVMSSRCSITCDEGFELAGDDVRTCQSDKEWDNDAPLCIGKIRNYKSTRRFTCTLMVTFLSPLLLEKDCDVNEALQYLLL